MNCARCNLSVKDHLGGDCPDGGGSFTFSVPRGPVLMDAVERIRQAAMRTGHGALAETAENFIHDFQPTEAPDWTPETDGDV